MPGTGIYVVQTCANDASGKPIFDPPVRHGSPALAVSSARSLEPTAIGVVAYWTMLSIELGQYDEMAVILFKSGKLPEPFN